MTVVAGLLIAAAGAAAAVAPARYIRFAEARPMVAELAGKLPADLNSLTAAQLEAAWPAWIERHDKDIRARLEQATRTRSSTDAVRDVVHDETKSGARRRRRHRGESRGRASAIELISARLDDLVAALANPGTDERRLFARALLQKKGLTFATAAGRETAR